MTKFRKWLIKKLGGYTDHQLSQPITITQTSVKPETLLSTVEYDYNYYTRCGEDNLKRMCVNHMIDEILPRVDWKIENNLDTDTKRLIGLLRIVPPVRRDINE